MNTLIRQLLILLFLVLAPLQGFSQTITPIKAGEPAPYDGYVIDKDFEQARRKDREELKLQKDKNVLLSDLNVLTNQRVDLYKQDSARAYSELNKQQLSTGVKIVLYFLGGLALGTAASYGMAKVYR